MKEALPYIFLVGAAIAFLGAVASLITPRAAIFFKKDRTKAAGAWVLICLACLVCMGKSIPEEQLKASKAKRAAAAQVEKEAEKASNVAGARKSYKSEDEGFEIFPYQVSQSIPRKTRHGRVEGGLIYIYPSQPDLELTSQTIGGTCLSAAKFFIDDYAKKYGDMDSMLVVITDMPYDIYKYNKEIIYKKIGKLAECHYLRTKSNGWEIIGLEASPRNTTPTEKQIEDLWVELHHKYKQGNRIVDYALKEVIGEKLNINPDDINFTPVTPEKMNPNQFKNIPLRGPEEALE